MIHYPQQNTIEKPFFTSVSLKLSNQKLLIEIPPIIHWSKHNKLTKLFSIYYFVLFINTCLFTFSNSLWGYILGLFLLAEIIIDGISNTYYYILMLIVLATYSIIFTINFGFAEIECLSILFIFADSIIFPMLRRKLIRDLFLKTKIEISFAQISIKRRLCKKWQLDFDHKLYDLPAKYYQTLMNKKLFLRPIIPYVKYNYSPRSKVIIKASNTSNVIIHENLNYKFGGFLSSQEKKWLYMKIKLYFQERNN